MLLTKIGVKVCKMSMFKNLVNDYKPAFPKNSRWGFVVSTFKVFYGQDDGVSSIE